MSPAKKKNQELLTLSEVSRQTGISMPTLQKYKKEHADRIPSEGKGRKQRYYPESLDVFRQLKEEGLSRRGKKKSNAKKQSRKKSKSKSQKSAAKKSSGKAVGKDGQELLSLQQIMRETKISYPTLLRYVKLHLDQLPHEGTGRKRRYYPEAVEVFRELRANSRRGRRPAASKKSSTGGGTKRSSSSSTGSVERRLAQLEKAHSSLEKQLGELIRVLKKPMTVTVRRS